MELSILLNEFEFDKLTFQANPDYKGVCHVALAQEGHCRPGEVYLLSRTVNYIQYLMVSS